MNFSQMALEKLNAASPGLSKYVIAFKDMSSELQDSDGVEVGAGDSGTGEGRGVEECGDEVSAGVCGGELNKI
jgi:hypothetical protein